MGCCRWHSAAASQGIHSFRLAKRSQSNPPMVIGECIGCEFRNSFGSSDPSPSGVGRGYVVRGRWPTSGRGAACSGEPSPQQKGAFPGLRARIPENSPSGLKTNFGGAPDPGLRPGLRENGPSGLNRKQTHGTNQTHAATASTPDGFRG